MNRNLLEALAAVLMLSLLLAAPALADPLSYARMQPIRASIHLAERGPTPARARAEAGVFRFVNDAGSMARVVFERRAVDRVACQSPSGETGRRGQYLVEPGQALVCTVREGKANYSVYRQGSGGQLEVHEGRIEAGS